MEPGTPFEGPPQLSDTFSSASSHRRAETPTYEQPPFTAVDAKELPEYYEQKPPSRRQQKSVAHPKPKKAFEEPEIDTYPPESTEKKRRKRRAKPAKVFFLSDSYCTLT